MMPKPLLNNPCSADWNKMLPAEGGRFCKKCCKVVVDFTQQSSEQILETIRKASAPVCGYMRNETVSKKSSFFGGKLPWRYSRFLAALYLVFGSLLFSTTSCGGMAEPLHDYPKTSVSDSAKKDSLAGKDSVLKDSLVNPGQ